MPEYLARDIVERMKEIINQDINYIDANSIIIASTDGRRVGTFHGGAKRVLSSGNKVVIHHDDEYSGAKQGINLPVYFNDSIIGVIGITGREKEVDKYGKIIQNMTEILIKEAYIVEQENIGRESKRQFIEELLFHRYKIDEKTIKTRSELLDIKMDVPRIVIMARIGEDHEKKTLNTPSFHEKLYNFIKRYVDFNIQNLIIQSSMSYILILDISKLKDINKLIENIHLNIEEKYGVKVCFGIGCASNNADEMRKSYKEAKKALDVSLTSRGNSIISYSELDIDLLLDEIPTTTKHKFVQKVFKNINPNKVNGYVEFLVRYFQNNGSITKTAAELYIHKNTVQYKLNTIKSLTGYDPRNIEDIAVLRMAVIVYSSEKLFVNNIYNKKT